MVCWLGFCYPKAASANETAYVSCIANIANSNCPTAAASHILSPSGNCVAKFIKQSASVHLRGSVHCLSAHIYQLRSSLQLSSQVQAQHLEDIRAKAKMNPVSFKSLNKDVFCTIISEALHPLLYSGCTLLT